VTTLCLLWQLVVAMGGVSLESLSVTGAPYDLQTEWQEIELREALTAKTGNPRLIVYLRDLAELGIERKHVVEQLPLILPPPSVQAEVYSDRGTVYRLRQTGYSFFRGMPGLVLEETGIPRGTTFRKLRVRAKVPMHGVTMIWLDSFGRSRPE
jgi:hypothetical protein